MCHVLTADLSTICSNATFICSTVEIRLTTLRWFFDDNIIGVFNFAPNQQYPFPVQSNDHASDVEIQVLEAIPNKEDQDLVQYLSTLTLNLSILQENDFSTVSCGTFSMRGVLNVSFDSNKGSEMLFFHH